MNGLSMTDRRPLRPSSVALAAAPTLERLLRNEPHLRVISTICPSGLRFEGEIDLCSREVLAAALDEAVQFGSGDLHVDLTDVTFIDVAGIRMMTTVARTLSRDGRRLLLHATPPGARKVIHVMGWEKTPGLMHCVGAML
ncbi:STAS domain-containing protein [Streptomyces sp. RLB3-17]|uniref:STAS domain-containing protein n=1 Tax=unclassified Streptomyces TaxID=2593676 RepID=UPI001162EEC1|nr:MULTISPECIES: STAS domain-containing protein [unclassified Streptomyces]QDN54786.1 STAS domain-containing protein [Streptomyces sp. S1D4-20]QDN64968.1 STAS domain-containing protein [Streptomyces sp. S1D4-14]QDN75285.1 STAS domain-containing protein [Streptomyces sp. S1A1-7]QDO37377.1 STAS domain-containing protein [Streptomyces sp. RLB3-17]QDO47375.1 STAS domain-containing protein [Streptomyces sp. RLB3-5]